MNLHGIFYAYEILNPITQIFIIVDLQQLSGFLVTSPNLLAASLRPGRLGDLRGFLAQLRCTGTYDDLRFGSLLGLLGHSGHES